MWRIVRRIGRVLAWIALVTVLVALLAVTTAILWARSTSGRRLLLARAVSLAQRQLAGRLTVGALEGDLTRQIVLRRVRVYDRDHTLALSIDAVRVDYDLLGLVSRRLAVRSLAIEGARVRARRLRDGGLNLARLPRTTPRPTAPPAHDAPRRSRWTAIIDALRLDGELVVELPSNGAPLHGRMQVTGGLEWRNDAPVFRDLLARIVVDAPLAAPLAATLEARGPADDLAAELVVRPATGELRARMHASIRHGRLSAWHATAESQDLDPATLIPDAPHGHIEVTARADGDDGSGVVAVEHVIFDAAGTHAALRGFVARDPSLRANLVADASSPELARLTGFGLRGSIAAHAHLRSSASRTMVNASFHGRRLRVGTRHVASLDGKVRVDEERGRVVASAHLDASGARPFAAELRAHGAWLRERHGVDLTLDRFALGEAEQRWQLTRPGRLRLDERALIVALALAAEEQTLTLDGEVDRRHGALRVELHGRQLDLRPPARLARLELPHTAIDVDARVGGTRAAPALDAKIRGRTLAWPQRHLPAIGFAVDAAADGRRLRCSANASAAGQTIDATIDAPLAPQKDASLTGELHGRGLQLAALRSLLSPSLPSVAGVADLSAHVSGTPHHATLAARWDARIGATAHGGVVDGELTLALDLLRAGRDPVAALARAPLSLRVRGHALELTQLPRPPLGAAPRAGVLDLALDVHGTMRAPEAHLHASLDGVAVSVLDGAALTLDAAYAAGRATATVQGTIRDQALALAARAESSFDVEPLLRGQLSLGELVARSTARAELHGHDLHVSELRLATLDGQARWNGRALTTTLDAREPAGGVLHLDAALPAAADAAIDATFTADAFRFALDNLGVVDDVGKVRRLEGTLAARLRVGGSRADPSVTGTLRVDHGAFAVGNDPRLFHDLTLALDAHDKTVELRRLALRVGGGALTAHGHITLAEREPAAIEMEAQAERFPFDPTNSEAWANATIELHGRSMDGRLVGTLTLSQGRAELPALAPRRQLQPTGPLEDVVYTDQMAAAYAHWTPPPIDVLAHIPGPFTIESPELQAQLRGELEVRTVDGKVELFGHAEALAGRLEILNREYEIEHARASFDGDLDPVIDVRVTRAIGDTKLVIAVHGTATAPQLELASDPPLYDPSQVLGFIVSGDPDDRRVNQSPTEQQLAGAISGVLVNKIKGHLVSGLPLDVIKIDPNADLTRVSGARVELGKYVRRDIYVGYVHHFGATMSDIHRTNTHEVNVRYGIRPRMIIGVRYGDAGIGSIHFAWTLRY